MDLEKEFQKLMDEAVQKVVEKRDNNELSVVEADDLIAMIAERRQPHEQAWSSSTQSCMDSYEYEREEEESRGWQRSSWCGDNG